MLKVREKEYDAFMRVQIEGPSPRGPEHSTGIQVDMNRRRLLVICNNGQGYQHMLQLQEPHDPACSPVNAARDLAMLPSYWVKGGSGHHICLNIEILIALLNHRKARDAIHVKMAPWTAASHS